MAIEKRTVSYDIAGRAFESLAVWDDAIAGPRPAVLIAPTFFGRSTFEEEKAEALAALGYVGFAMDLFGDGMKPANVEEASAAIGTLGADRPGLAVRMTATLEQMRALERVDRGRAAAIGFCFGGKCVLDLARTGVDIAGVVAFHGIFDAPPQPTADRIAARVLALHGWDDPLATPDDVMALTRELDAKHANWELVAYGATEHAFTNYARPEMYRPQADARSWARLVDFLDELFG